MTPEQRRLARHALGLPNKGRRSYRNRFICSATTPNGFEWLGMVAKGWAKIDPDPRALDFFWLTPAGTLMVLDKGERLDPEDFPEMRQ